MRRAWDHSLAGKEGAVPRMPWFWARPRRNARNTLWPMLGSWNYRLAGQEGAVSWLWWIGLVSWLKERPLGTASFPKCLLSSRDSGMSSPSSGA